MSKLIPRERKLERAFYIRALRDTLVKLFEKKKYIRTQKGEERCMPIIYTNKDLKNKRAVFFFLHSTGLFLKSRKNGSAESRGHILQPYRQHRRRRHQMQFQSKIEKLFRIIRNNRGARRAIKYFPVQTY